jgi:hypothetical protein
MPTTTKRALRQEISVAIVAGLVIASIITMIIYLSQNRSTTPTPATTATPTATPTTTLPDKPPTPIEFTGLVNETVYDHKSITVTGHTFPNLPIVIFINQKDFFTQSDAAGNFALDINLESGSNVITATVVDQDGSTYTAEILLVYTNKSLEEILLTEDELKAQDASATPGSTSP